MGNRRAEERGGILGDGLLLLLGLLGGVTADRLSRRRLLLAANAVAMVEAGEGQSPNTVVAEHEKGYYLYDRVLRPAMVTVAASSKAAGD